MPGLDPGIHPNRGISFKDDGLPGHKRVYTRLRRAMPGNDGGWVSANGRWYERLMRAFVSQRRYAWPARTRRPGMAPVCSPRSKVGVPAKSVAT